MIHYVSYTIIQNVSEKGQRDVRPMKRWMKQIGASILAGCIGIGGYTVWKLEPVRHFKYVDFPVLAVPSLDGRQAPSRTLNQQQSPQEPLASSHSPDSIQFLASAGDVKGNTTQAFNM